MPAIKGDMYINTHCNYSQPASIKLDNENIGGHCYTFTKYALECPPKLFVLPLLAAISVRQKSSVLRRYSEWSVQSSATIVRARSPVASLCRSAHPPCVATLRVKPRRRRLGAEKLHPFCFCSNFVKPHYILIICCTQILK